MCGIAGIIGRLNDTNRAALRRMGDAMSHRGPDGEGFWESPAEPDGCGVMLAHRRLSILDLSNAGAQPMVDPTTGDTIVANCEIYNYVELRKRLVAAGHKFQSTGDTAVMLRALSMEGTSAISTLRGMFAFAFWDRGERRLTLARDPLGIKPLYIARNPDPAGDWSLAFASEVRAILASGLLAHPRLNPSAAASIVWNGFMVAPQTAVNQIESLLPGEFRVYDIRGNETGRQAYWTGVPSAGAPHVDENELERILLECVRLHLASDVPLGVFLSGGVDSSAVANLAQRAADRPVNTFTLNFEEQEFSEGKIARQVADAIGAQHRELVLTEAQFVSRLESALESLDQPTFDGLNSYYMSHAVREAGFTVALVGSGGDELFGGYASFRDLPRLMHWSRPLRGVPWLREALAKGIRGRAKPRPGTFPPQTRWAKLPDMLAHCEDPVSLYQLAYALFLPSAQRELLTGDVSHALRDGLPASVRDTFERACSMMEVLPAIGYLERSMFLGERLLRDTDAASMSASLEIRLPLVDQLLAEQVGRLRIRDRFDPIGRKAMLRRIGLRGLDPQLFERPKAGFVLPFDRWLKSSLGKSIDSTLRDPEAIRPTGLDPAAVSRLWQSYLDGAPGLYWTRIWAIYVFLRWCHRHRVYL